MLHTRWVRRSKSGERDNGDWPGDGRPATAATTETKDEADALIRDDKLTVRRNRDWKCGGYGHNQRTCLQKSAHKVDAVQQKQSEKTSVQNLPSAVRNTKELFCQV